MTSGAPPRAPTPGPDIGGDRQGLLEFFDVIKVRRPPVASEWSGHTRCSDTTFISTGQDLRSVESYEDPMVW